MQLADDELLHRNSRIRLDRLSHLVSQTKHEFVRVIVVLRNLISEGPTYTNDVLKNPQAGVKLVAIVHKQMGARGEDGQGRQTLPVDSYLHACKSVTRE